MGKTALGGQFPRKAGVAGSTPAVGSQFCAAVVPDPACIICPQKSSSDRTRKGCLSSNRAKNGSNSRFSSPSERALTSEVLYQLSYVGLPAHPTVEAQGIDPRSRGHAEAPIFRICRPQIQDLSSRSALQAGMHDRDLTGPYDVALSPLDGHLPLECALLLPPAGSCRQRTRRSLECSWQSPASSRPAG
jgi:hypothetical protein